MSLICCLIFGLIWTTGPCKIAARHIQCHFTQPVDVSYLTFLENKEFWTIKYVGSTEEVYPSGTYRLSTTEYTFPNNSYQYLKTLSVAEQSDLVRPWYKAYSFDVDAELAVFQSDTSVQCESGEMSCYGTKQESCSLPITKPMPEITFALIDVRMRGDLLVFKSCLEPFYWVQISHKLMTGRYLRKKSEARTSELQSHHSIFRRRQKMHVNPIDPVDDEIEEAFKALNITPANIIPATDGKLLLTSRLDA